MTTKNIIFEYTDMRIHKRINIMSYVHTKHDIIFYHNNNMNEHTIICEYNIILMRNNNLNKK